ncbi:DUF2062 domain-containing protein [Hymenobacter terricola]|uniref:DUF2062 domain-containing protein n=1 Tax=Hymenobacter terricola TaxID=2819236 RepID=UPI001B31723F|nr:DUF2062 domain-containing protein [Hymenobacter terricola]
MLNPPPPPVSESTATASGAPVGWLQRRVVAPLVGLLRQGLAPEQLALTVALGIAAGVVPVLGGIAPVATLVALRLRLNMAAIQLISHLMTPLQLLLLVPLLHLGARLLGNAQEQNITLVQVRQLFAHDWRAALHLLWRAELGAVLLWLLGSVPVVAVLYFVLRPLFRRLARRVTAGKPAADPPAQ